MHNRLFKADLSACFSWVFLFWCSLFSSVVTGQTLPQPVANLLRQANLSDDSIGIAVLPVNNNPRSAASRKRLQWQSSRPLQPASTIKVLTSIASLELLGPTYVGSTTLLSATKPRQDVLAGDLVLRGRGDPDLTRAALLQMLIDLKRAGVTTIEGDLLLDRTWFEPARPDLGVPAFDETPEFRYNVIPDALSLEMNLIGLRLESTELVVRVAIDPPVEGIELENQLTLNTANCADWEDQWRTPVTTIKPEQIILTGAFPKNCTATTLVNVLDRTVYAETLFRTLWQSVGGAWQGRARELTSAQVLALGPLIELSRHESRPLSELVRDINKRSDNQVSRLVYAALGASSDRSQDTQTAADQQMRNWLQSKQIDPTGLVMDNGSGLSRSARITPAQLAQVLQAALTSRWAPEFLASLPIVGVDGSMRNRLKNSTVAAQARIKTGGLRNVASIAGYVTDVRGKQWVVVGIINHEQGAGRVGRKILDALIQWVADAK